MADAKSCAVLTTSFVLEFFEQRGIANRDSVITVSNSAGQLSKLNGIIFGSGRFDAGLG